MIRIVILGFGNVGQHLFRAFSTATEIEVIQVYNRSKIEFPKSIQTDFTSDINKLKEADLYIIAVSDDYILSVSETLPFNNNLVVHTSGSVAMKPLSNNNRKGVFYLLQSFSNNRKVDFSEIPICVEASNEVDLKLLKVLGNSISDNVVEINSEEREKLHLSAVIVNNFVNYLYQVGNDLLSEASLSFDLLKPLIKETALKIETLTPSEAQTGPAKRNDKKTIEKHLHLLKDSPYKNLYKRLTEAIQDKHNN